MKSRKREAFQKQNKVTDVKIIRKIRRKIMKKKIISVLLASMMVIGLVGCGGSKETADGASSTTIQTNPDIVQQMIKT